MTRIARRIALVLLPLGIAACASVYDDGYGDIYGSGYPGGIYGDRVYGGSVYDRYPDPYYDNRIYRADGHVFRSAAERDAYLRGVRAAEHRALREAQLRRQAHHADRAARELRRTERELAHAERELRRAERRDRHPVRSGPYDRADTQRRQALFDERRARIGQEQAERQARRTQDRLARDSRAAAALERIERMERMERRQEARAALAATGVGTGVQPPPGNQRGSVEDERERRARIIASRESIPIESVLRERVPR